MIKNKFLIVLLFFIFQDLYVLSMVQKPKNGRFLTTNYINLSNEIEKSATEKKGIDKAFENLINTVNEDPILFPYVRTLIASKLGKTFNTDEKQIKEAKENKNNLVKFLKDLKEKIIEFIKEEERVKAELEQKKKAREEELKKVRKIRTGVETPKPAPVIPATGRKPYVAVRRESSEEKTIKEIQDLTPAAVERAQKWTDVKIKGFVNRINTNLEQIDVKIDEFNKTKFGIDTPIYKKEISHSSTELKWIEIYDMLFVPFKEKLENFKKDLSRVESGLEAWKMGVKIDALMEISDLLNKVAKEILISTASVDFKKYNARILELFGYYDEAKPFKISQVREKVIKSQPGKTVSAVDQRALLPLGIMNKNMPKYLGQISKFDVNKYPESERKFINEFISKFNEMANDLSKVIKDQTQAIFDLNEFKTKLEKMINGISYVEGVVGLLEKKQRRSEEQIAVDNYNEFKQEFMSEAKAIEEKPKTGVKKLKIPTQLVQPTEEKPEEIQPTQEVPTEESATIPVAPPVEGESSIPAAPPV